MCSHEPRRNILCHQPDFSREGRRKGRQENGKKEFDAGDPAPLDTMDKKICRNLVHQKGIVSLLSKAL